MSSNQSADESRPRSAAQFATTHWSTVLVAGHILLAAEPKSRGHQILLNGGWINDGINLPDTLAASAGEKPIHREFCTETI
jgi:hypothetical protein